MGPPVRPGAHDQGLVITTGAFSVGARREAERPNATPVALMDGEELVSLLIEYGMGVRKAPLHLLELAEDALEECDPTA